MTTENCFDAPGLLLTGDLAATLENARAERADIKSRFEAIMATKTASDLLAQREAAKAELKKAQDQLNALLEPINDEIHRNEAAMREFWTAASHELGFDSEDGMRVSMIPGDELRIFKAPEEEIPEPIRALIKAAEKSGASVEVHKLTT